MFVTIKTLIFCAVLVSVLADDPIEIPPSSMSEDCQRFDNYYLQSVELIQDYTQAQCDGKNLKSLVFGLIPESLAITFLLAGKALQYFKDLHALRNEVKKVGKCVLLKKN